MGVNNAQHRYFHRGGRTSNLTVPLWGHFFIRFFPGKIFCVKRPQGCRQMSRVSDLKINGLNILKIAFKFSFFREIKLIL